MFELSARSKFRIYCLTLLVIFLPISSWLVSLTGQPTISLVRDVLVFLLFLVVLPGINLQRLKSPLNFLILLYILWIVFSYFWTGASVLQWLRGVRFSAVPMIFLLVLSLTDFSRAEKKVIMRSVIWMSLFVVVLAVLELIGVKLPLTTVFSGEGALSADHFVGAANIRRLQSVLAGPNALGLYLLVMIALILSWKKELNILKWLIWFYLLIAILTFSRSVWIGLIVLSFVAFITRYKFSTVKIVEFLMILLIACAGIYMLARNSVTVKQIIVHGVSTSERVAEYERIWQNRDGIGLLGRGAGSAGPSTQVRLDNGPNYWSENTYLDIFEEFGAIGFLLFACIIIALWRRTISVSRDVPTLQAVRLILPAFLVAGLFINLYTGQVAAFTFLLIVGLSQSEREYQC